MDGDENVFFGISGDDDALLELASIFAKEDFKDFDDNASLNHLQSISLP